MKVYIMTDLEGVAGVQDSSNWCLDTGRYYAKAKELLTAEVNAAIEGFLEGGATEILVADGHGPGALNIDQLHPRAQFARNWHSAGVFSLDEKNFDFAAWVGQHPMAGTIGGHLTHTGNMGVIEQSVNGIPVGEFGYLVMLASERNIRSIFASGCEAFCKEASSFVPGIETTAVKKGTQTTSGNHLPRDAYREHNKAAIHLNPLEARKKIREGALRAITRASKEDFGIIKLPSPPFTFERVLRGDDKYPPRLLRMSNPESLIKMVRSPIEFYELEINPASKELRSLIGKKIA